MGLQQLSCDKLGDLDNGVVRELIDKAIAEAVRDADDRGDDCQPRVVTIEISMKKQVAGRDAIATDVQVKLKLPALRSNVTDARIYRKGKAGVLAFQERNAENADQPDLDFPEEK